MKKGKTQHLFLLLFLLVFFFVAGFHNFLHDHPADTDEHKDCVVFLFLLVAKATIIIIIFLFFVSFLALFHFLLPDQEMIFQTYITIYGIRGPPARKPI